MLPSNCPSRDVTRAFFRGASGVRAAAAMALAITGAAGAISLPPGFHATAISPVLNKPVAMAFAPDGRLFIAEQAGIVKVIDHNQVTSTFINLKGEVGFGGDRGLLGIALDPNFMSTHYVYLLYTADPIPGSPNEPALTGSYGRLTRYKGTNSSDGNVANLLSRKVLIGKAPHEGIPACFSAHTVAALRMSPDGTLLVSAGDGGSYLLADGGGNTPSCFVPDLFGSDQDIGSFRAQSLHSLAGKILRVRRTNGMGLPSNPFYNGDRDAIQSKIWAYGLRNPWRFTFKPGTGGPDQVPTLFVGDVGWNSFEEINVSYGGENFGWPCHEGPGLAPDFPNMTPANSGCDTIGTPDNPGPLTDPLVTWNHNDASQSDPQGFTGHCVIGGVFYTGNKYPAEYHNAYFFAEFVLNWMKVLTVDDNDQLQSLNDFATDSGGPVDFAIHPQSGDVCFLSLADGRAYRIRYQNSNMMAAGGDDDASAPQQESNLAGPQGCPADIATSAGAGSDGVVDVNDLLAVINAADDANGDDVSLPNLLAVINSWGPCPQ